MQLKMKDFTITPELILNQPCVQLCYSVREGGGSTLTQQLAKALLDHERKSKAIRVIQKLKEWIIAVKLERNFTKEEIIALYLNAVPFGNNVYGIRNASHKLFFKKNLID